MAEEQRGTRKMREAARAFKTAWEEGVREWAGASERARRTMGWSGGGAERGRRRSDEEFGDEEGWEEAQGGAVDFGERARASEKKAGIQSVGKAGQELWGGGLGLASKVQTYKRRLHSPCRRCLLT